MSNFSSLIRCGWLVILVLLASPYQKIEAAEPIWIPASSPDLTGLVRRVEESIESKEEAQILSSIGTLAERLMDGDPGGTTPVGGGLSVGAGVYLRSTVARLAEPLRERVLAEIRLRTNSRFSKSPAPGLDADQDLRRTSILMDLPEDTFPAQLVQSLAESALERGDLETWQRAVELEWIEQHQFNTDRARTIEMGPATKPDTMLLPTYIGPGNYQADTHDDPWKSAGGRTGAVSDGTFVWIQFPGEIRAIDLRSSEEVWRRVEPELKRHPLPRTLLRPVRRGSRIIASFTSSLEALDGITGRQIWSINLEQILGPEDSSQSIRAISSPCSVSGGVVVVAVINQGDRLKAYASRIDDQGRITWVRPLGESTGSTWLALQSAPAPPISGIGRVHWSTGRGTVISIRTADGAIEWIRDLNSPSNLGLRNHLIKNPISGELLRRNRSRLFAQPPGAAGIHILNTANGNLMDTIPTHSTDSWSLSTDGEFLTTIEDSQLSCWSCPQSGSPQFLWKVPLPIIAQGNESDVIAAPDGGWWISHGDVIACYDRTGILNHLQGIGFSCSELEPLQGALLARSGPEVHILAPAPSQIDWVSFVSTLRDEQQRLDLSGNLPHHETLRRTIELWLERTDIEFTEIDRIALETALISARTAPENRISFAWQRALHSKEISAFQCASMICTLMLNESPRTLKSTLVESRQGQWVTAEVAFTHMLLELDQAQGGADRIIQRESRARLESQDLTTSSSPDRWQTLARMRPGCPAGRKARLNAAEAYYRMGDMNRCLHQIDLLLIREPDTDEALIGSLRRSEVLREVGRMAEAISEIELLNRSHGDRIMTRVVDGIEQTTTLGQRLQELRDEIEVLPHMQRNHPGLPLELAWNGRLELSQTRASKIWPLSRNTNYPDDPRILILTTESAQLIDSRDGVLIWRTDLGRNSTEVRGGIVLTRRDVPSTPLLIDETGVVFHDRNRIWRIQLETGAVAWSQQLPASEEDPSEEIRIEQSCAGNGIVVLVTENEQFLGLDAGSGEVLWQQHRSGALLDDPIIRDDQLIIGYSIPNKVEIRSLKTGTVQKKLDLDPATDALASNPLPMPTGIIVALERGRISKYDADGIQIWSTDLPHVLSDVRLSPDDTQLVCELFWSADRPTLLGIDSSTGKIGWKRSLPADQRRITALQIESDELLLVCGDFQKRTIMRLRASLATTQAIPPETELEWTHQLAPAYDSVDLEPQGDWIVVGDRLRGEVTILDRATGTPLTIRQGIGVVTEHLKTLGRLHHASVIGETLVTVSARGTAGFRSTTAREQELSTWQSLQDSSDWRQEAMRLLSIQEPLKVVDLLEEKILDPETQPLQRATASWILEGAERQRAKSPQEEHPIRKLQVPPIIDGSLDELWNATRGIALDQPRHVRGLQGPGEPRIPWQDQADLSGRVFLGWSDEGLHIAVDTDDDNITTHLRESKRWIGDCLILVLDTRGDGGIRPRGDDQVLTLAFVPPKPEPVDEGDPQGDQEGEAPPPFEEEEEESPEGEHIVVRRADGTGAVYEMTIPWTSIAEQRGEVESVPWPGMQMRIGIAITDDDTGRGATKYLGLTPGMVLHRDLDRIWEGCSPDLMLPVRLEK